METRSLALESIVFGFPSELFYRQVQYLVHQRVANALT